MNVAGTDCTSTCSPGFFDNTGRSCVNTCDAATQNQVTTGLGIACVCNTGLVLNPAGTACQSLPCPAGSPLSITRDFCGLPCTQFPNQVLNALTN